MCEKIDMWCEGKGPEVRTTKDGPYNRWGRWL